MVSVLRPALEMAHELRGAWRITADRRSFGIYAHDIVAHRLLRIHRPADRPERTILARGGALISYRRDRGDIYEVREVWIDEAYTLPAGFVPDVVIDLGAHIGLTTLWLAARYSPSRMIAVEPSPSNAAIARKNFHQNAVHATLVEAAIGSRDGMGSLHEAHQSNLTQVVYGGGTVAIQTMAALLSEHLPRDSDVDLLKVDIEGAEHDLLSGDVSWLARVKVVLAEIHPTSGPRYNEFIAKMERHGFELWEQGRVKNPQVTCFVRVTAPATAIVSSNERR